MTITKCILLLILIHISVINSQSFNIGILDSDLMTFLSPNQFPNFTLQLVSLPNPITINNYANATSVLATYDAIIGRFDFTVATICQQLNLTYFFLGDFISTYPGSLLEVGSDLITEGQMLLIYLNKYNINFPMRYISDSTNDSINFRLGLGESTIAQCNFNLSDTDESIQLCYKLVFLGSAKYNYVFVTDTTNLEQLRDKYLQQALLSSLTFNSMIFFPMVDIGEILNRYFYSGSYLFEIAPEMTTIFQTGTLIQRKAMLAYTQIFSSLSSYRKINTTHWTSNNVTTPYNSSVILNLIKTANGIYQPNGQMVTKSYYLYTIFSQNLMMVTSFTYGQTWTESPGIPNPALTGSKGFVTIVYILDSTFINEVNTPAGIIIKGFAVDLLNYLLVPIQLSYISFKFTPAIIGLRSNNTFSGIYGQMANNLYTMTAFPVPVRAQYRSQLTYSNEVFDIQYSFLTKIPSKSVSFTFLAQPFSPLVWIVIIVTICFLALILFLTNLISPNVADDNDKLTIPNSIFMVFGSFLVAKMLVKPNMFSTQILYLLIWLGTLLLIASYISNLVVATAFDNSTKVQFTTVNQLFNLKNYKWAFVNNSYLHNSIMLDSVSNPNSIYKRMFDYAQETWRDKYLIQPENVDRFVNDNPDFGVLNDNIHNLMISLQDCNVTTVVDTTVTVSLAYVINPTYQYFQEISNQILLQRENGVIDLLLSKYFATGNCPITIVRNGGIDSFDYQDICGVFLLISAGIIMSLIVSGIEYFLKKGNLQCQRLVKGNSLQFGQIYKAKVKALDKGGVTVDIGRQSCFSRKNDARIYYIPKKNLVGKGKSKEDIPSPTEQGIMIGTTLYLKYLGNNPDDSKRKFIQVQKK